MALDGMFMHKLACELNAELENTRVEKIYQPSADELIFIMRSFSGSKKLYFNSRADSARVHLIHEKPENPQKPPTLCMLLRKKYAGAKFEGITQSGLERILNFNFSGTDEMGDKINLRIYAEIMGRYSNVVFVQNGRIIDSLKRVGAEKSSVRKILPGYEYRIPPQQDKICLLDADCRTVAEKILSNENMLLSKAILKTVQGISPLVCREMVFRLFGNDVPVYSCTGKIETLAVTLEKLKEDFTSPSGAVMLKDGNKPKEFSFTDISQFGDLYEKVVYSCCSELLEDYYFERGRFYRSAQRSGELMKNVRSSIERLSKKIDIQSAELAKSRDNDKLRLYGELINANSYHLKSGESEYAVENYYSGETVKIKVDPRLTPSENAVKYYKEYKKAENAQSVLQNQIEKAESELYYLESIYDLLSRAETSDEIEAVRNELAENGYIKKKNLATGKKTKEIPPLEYRTSGGFRVLVGRNNTANDKLTFKTAFKTDIWFHTKNVHGSHTVLLTEKKDVPKEDIVQAAEICAYHSKARESSGVAVDYTEIRFVKRRPGGLPGTVFYSNYKTVYVTPHRDCVEKMKV